MENEIITNEVVEATENVLKKTGLSKNAKIALCVGGVVLAGFVTYKYVIKTIIGKKNANEDVPEDEENEIIVDNSDEIETGEYPDSEEESA